MRHFHGKERREGTVRSRLTLMSRGQGIGALVAPDVGSEGAVPTLVLAPNLRAQCALSP